MFVIVVILILIFNIDHHAALMKQKDEINKETVSFIRNLQIS